MTAKDSSMPGFYAKTPDERLGMAGNFAGLNDADLAAFRAGMSMDLADSLVENAIGIFALPLGVATNFRINGRDYLIPMSTEEPSVIAAASAGAKAAPDIKAASSPSRLVGQIQVLNPRPDATKMVEARRRDILREAGKHVSGRMSVVDVSAARLDASPPMVKVEIGVDTGEAMGANAVNTMCEGVSGMVEDITGGRVLLRILSNAAPREGFAEAYFDVPGDVAGDMVNAYRFALADSSRAVTHNKGIMNGIVAVAVATGQDTRALEAGAHAHAAGPEGYKPLSAWEIREDRLWGSVRLPLGVGTVGGLTKHHPAAAASLKMLGNPTASQLAGIMAAVGLCQNFSALRALATDGIQKGHMKLHRRRI